MNNYLAEKIDGFFAGIHSWRKAYRYARLNYMGVKKDEKLLLLSARLYLEIQTNLNLLPVFNVNHIQAGQWEIPLGKISVEEVINALLSPQGLQVEGHGQIVLAIENDQKYSASGAILLHQEGINNGNRLAVLPISGAQRHAYLPQPETDWMLKAGTTPFDNLNELTLNYGLGTVRGDFASLEVIARTAVQIFADSEVHGKTASMGIWMANSLDKFKTHIGYRVIVNGDVVKRASLLGNHLIWTDKDEVTVGLAEIEVPLGSIIQCFACYEGHAHHIEWRADPDFFLNPRSAVLASVDATGELLKSYLFPDLPPRGKESEHFEIAINWILWALGFSPATFGIDKKTKDYFDTVAVSPNGDFLAVECTLGLLRAESKLSKLAARAAKLRELLDASNMKHLRILPIIVTAMSLEEVKADIASAEETGILVLTKENLEQIFNELLRFPNADNLYERGIARVEENSNKNQTLFPELPLV